MQPNHSEIPFLHNILAKIKAPQYQVSVRRWSNWNSQTLLVDSVKIKYNQRLRNETTEKLEVLLWEENAINNIKSQKY